MSDPVTALAMTGATTLVAAMATSAWESARSRAVALFGRRGDSERDTRARLDRSAARVRAAEPDDSADAVRTNQIARWQDDLFDLLSDRPETEGELRALIDDIQQQFPPVQQQWIQHVTARDGGSAFGALGPDSSVNVHYHTSDGELPTTPPAGPGAGGTR
jgi:hypothetical protein